MRKWSQIVAALSVLIAVPAWSQSSLEEVIEAFDAHELSYDLDRSARRNGTLPATWPDVTPDSVAEKRRAEAELLTALRALDLSDRDDQDQLSAGILETILKERVSRAPLDEARIPFTGDWGFQAIPVFGISRARIADLDDAEATLDRLEAIPAFLADNVSNMRRGIDTGYVAHGDPLGTVMEQIREQLADSPTDSQLYQPFETLPSSISEPDQRRLQREARAAIARALTGYRDTLRFLETEYAPNARPNPGLASLENGQDIYQVLVRIHTTRDAITAEEVHRIGLEEVARIRAEMDAIIEEVGFDGSFAEFLDFLRTNEDFYARTPEALLAAAARMSKDLDLEMPKFFSSLPRLPYGVTPVPMAIAPGYTTGRYISGDLETGDAGQYWVNTYALDQRPLYELPALTAHEAVPGHHHQIALAQELRDVPEFRRTYYATAFGEGWGLYSESLAGEMGLYKTPYERFGKLSYEMWRACRLVADTGLHHYNWSREKAESCFIENSALAPLNIKTEVTRYIGWPGQATAYKIGELTIQRLRSEAEAALGEDFDIRAFHDHLLGAGTMPLSLLEARMAKWVEGQKD